MLAHDLNNSLGVILGRCELLKRHLHDDAEARKQLDAIEKAARRMAAIVAERVAGESRNLEDREG